MTQSPAALSIRQPWAALVVAGIKTVEVRTWATRRRGRILIHAGKVQDNRPEGWKLIDTPELRDLACLRGGIIGAVDLIACIPYTTVRAFADAIADHRNEPHWFRRRGLYGFVFRKPHPIPYHPCVGQTMFFLVKTLSPSLEAFDAPG